jgi:hypothetical protein
MGEYVSPIDGHRHFGDAGRAECAVCCLEAERDRLRAVVEDITAHASPIAEDDDGFVAVGYTITIGAIWDPSTGDAVFDSTRARAIGDRLLAEIRARIVGDRSDELREQRDTARSQRAALAQRCERLDERRHELHDLLTVVETERDRLRAVVVATATDARVLVKVLGQGSADAAAALAERIYDRHEPYDVGEQLDGSQIMGRQPAEEPDSG